MRLIFITFPRYGFFLDFIPPTKIIHASDSSQNVGSETMVMRSLAEVLNSYILALARVRWFCKNIANCTRRDITIMRAGGRCIFTARRKNIFIGPYKNILIAPCGSTHKREQSRVKNESDKIRESGREISRLRP